MLVLHLGHQDRSAIRCKERLGNLCHGFEITPLRYHEVFVLNRADLEVGVLQQRGGNAAEIPLATHIGAGPEKHRLSYLQILYSRGAYSLCA